MAEISKEVVALVVYLLPGFLVAWIFYALTSHPKPNHTERVIQALIFNLLVNAVVAVEKHLLLGLGKWHQLGIWDKDAELVASTTSAIALGLLVSYITNNDIFHARLRRMGLSQRSSSPNEWCTVFGPRDQFIVLELRDKRRAYGWPAVWPSDPEKGHFFLTLASWIHGAEAVELKEAEGILVNVKDISHIEFAKLPEVSS